MAQIEEYEREIAKMDKENKVEERKKLYCKMSALKARVKRRREAMWQSQTQSNFNTQFNKLANIIADCLEMAERDTVVNGLQAKKPK